MEAKKENYQSLVIKTEKRFLFVKCLLGIWWVGGGEHR